MIKITKNLVDPSKYSTKCPYSMTPEFIIIHNTYNDASAENEIAYMTRNNYQVSYHFAVDEKEVVQGLPLDRNSWNAGDGGNGDGNRKGISIEICYSKSGGAKYIKAEENAVKLTAQLLHERRWGVDKVKKHQDFSGKYCPHRILSEGRWDSFVGRVEDELNRLNTPTLHWKQIAVKELLDSGIITSEEWLEIERLDKPLPSWATFIIANNIYKRLGGK